MMMPHPFDWLSIAAQKRAFVTSFIIMLVVGTVLLRLDQPLRTDAAPNGIVSFELAGDLASARAMVESWDEEARLSAAMSLGIDYLYLLAYSTTIALGCVLVARRFAPRMKMAATLGLALAWPQWLAAALDGVENYALIQLLLGHSEPYLPVVALWCAVPKFVIVFAGLAYLLAGLVVIVADRLTGRAAGG